VELTREDFLFSDWQERIAAGGYVECSQYADVFREIVNELKEREEPRKEAVVEALSTLRNHSCPK